jgi:hypothetical protein
MQTEIHTAEPLVPEPSSAEVEVAIRKMIRYKAPGSDQILAELIQAGGGGTLHSEIHKLCTRPGAVKQMPHSARLGELA